MPDFPPWFERLLRLLGFSPTWVRWRLRYMGNWWRETVARLRPSGTEKKRYKWCRHCGQMALAEDKVCACGKPLPSYIVSQAERMLAIHFGGLHLVSGGLLATIFVVYGAQLSVFGLGNLLGPSEESFWAFGGFSTQAFLAGDFWRAMTMALQHIGVIHIIFNFMAISQLLPRFEEDIGPWQALIVITLTQFGAVAAHMHWALPDVPTAGASGIGFGLIGFGLGYCHRNKLVHERRFYVQWLIYGLIFGYVVRANNAAHIGGFLAGLPLGWLFGPRFRSLARLAMAWAGIACLCLWCVSIAFLIHSIATSRPG